MRKTALTVITFSAVMLLPQVQSIDFGKLVSVLNLPVPKPKVEPVETPRTAIKLPENLADPKHELDRFYEALLKNGTVRIVHYGDSPTTGDLITADARAALQKQFGDA